MAICARIERASTSEVAYLRFGSWQELLEYMKSRYHRWVVIFGLSEFYRKSIEEFLGRCEEYAHLILYDDYIE